MFPPEEKAPEKKNQDPKLPPPGPPDTEQPPPRPRQPYPDFPPHQPFPDPDGPFGPFGGGPLYDQPGGADLDPTGQRGRGGMLMEPPRGGGSMGQPRFENPFGQSNNIGRFPRGMGPGFGGGRNLGDAMRPPGFNDDMFM